MDPLIVSSLIASSFLLLIELVKIASKVKAKHFHSSCCDLDINNSSPKDMDRKKEDQ